MTVIEVVEVTYGIEPVEEVVKVFEVVEQGPPGSSGSDPETLRRNQDDEHLLVGNLPLSNTAPYHQRISTDALNRTITVSAAFEIINVGDFVFSINNGTTTVELAQGRLCKISSSLRMDVI